MPRKAADLGVISQSVKKFEGKGGHDPWFGPTAFTVFGERRGFCFAAEAVHQLQAA